MKLAAILIAFSIATTSVAETIILPIQDLLMDIPSFEGPKFDLNSAINGTQNSSIKKPAKDKKAFERKILSIAWDMYPDALYIRVLQGNLIIKLPETSNEDL